MEELVVRQKPSRQLKLIVYAVVLTAASVFCVLRPGKTSDMIRITGVIGGLFFTLCLALLLMQLLRPKVVLFINASGISGDFSSVRGPGFVPWQAVAGYGVTSLMGQRFISVELNDVDGFLKTMPAWKARAIRASIALGFPPFSFPMQTADRPIEEILATMDRFYAASGKQSVFG